MADSICGGRCGRARALARVPCQVIGKRLWLGPRLDSRIAIRLIRSLSRKPPIESECSRIAFFSPVCSLVEFKILKSPFFRSQFDRIPNTKIQTFPIQFQTELKRQRKPAKPAESSPPPIRYRRDRPGRRPATPSGLVVRRNIHAIVRNVILINSASSRRTSDVNKCGQFSLSGAAQIIFAAGELSFLTSLEWELHFLPLTCRCSWGACAPEPAINNPLGSPENERESGKRCNYVIESTTIGNVDGGL